MVDNLVEVYQVVTTKSSWLMQGKTYSMRNYAVILSRRMVYPFNVIANGSVYLIVTV